MSEHCGICGSEIGKMASSYKIGELQEQMCFTCKKKIDLISFNTKNGVKNTEYVDDFKKMLANGTISNDVREYIENCLHENNCAMTKEEQQQYIKEKTNKIMINSGFNYEGYKIVKYYDYIVEESAMGIGAFKSMFNEMSEFWGTESSGARKRLKQGKETVINRLKYEAAKLGANAIIGIDLDYSTFSNDTLIVVASGTAVKIEKIVE